MLRSFTFQIFNYRLHTQEVNYEKRFVPSPEKGSQQLDLCVYACKCIIDPV